MSENTKKEPSVLTPMESVHPNSSVGSDPVSEETSDDAPERSYVSKKLHHLKMFLLARPIMFVAAFSMLVVFSLQGGMLFSEYKESTAEKDRLKAIPSAQMAELNDLIKNNQVESVTRHAFFSQGLMKTRPEWFIEIKKKDNTEVLIEENTATSEEIWKNLVQLSFAHPFEVKSGYYSGSESLMQKGLQTVLFLGLILLLLVGAQKLTAEVLSGKSFRPKKPNKDIMFKDVVGIPKVKQMMVEIKDQLENRKGYSLLNIECPQGVMFVGDPGVGKTLLANAFANEVKADFFLANGSDFAEMFVGVGPKRIRALFAEARQCSRAVIFIDEFDAIGSRDGMGLDSERRNTINALLSELDGVEKNTNVLVIAATNHQNKIDPALLRRGRFDKIVQIPLPTQEDRRKILALNLRKMNLSKDVDLEFMARRTVGYSGATLAGIAADAKNLALRRVGGFKNSKDLMITQEDLLFAQEVALLGEEGRTAKGDELRRVAVHELGHALAGKMYCNERKFVEKVTLNGRGQALGYTASLPTEETLLVSEGEYKGDLVSLLGGRAAEQVIFGNVSNGASDDLRRANAIARAMVTQFGMGKRTGLHVSMTEQDELTKNNLDDIDDILKEAYTRAVALLNSNKEWLVSTSELLQQEMELNHEQMFSEKEFVVV